MDKPNKIIYENQKEVYNTILETLKRNLLNQVSEAYVIGSLSKGQFGVYEEEFHCSLGSDIDLVAFPNDKIPENWKQEKSKHNWYSKYSSGFIKIEKTNHPIEIMIPFERDLKTFWEKAKELNWKVNKIK